MWETWVRSLGWEDPLEKGKAAHLQYSGLENSMDYIVLGVAKSQTQMSDCHFHFQALLGCFTLDIVSSRLLLTGACPAWTPRPPRRPHLPDPEPDLLGCPGPTWPSRLIQPLPKPRLWSFSVVNDRESSTNQMMEVVIQDLGFLRCTAPSCFLSWPSLCSGCSGLWEVIFKLKQLKVKGNFCKCLKGFCKSLKGFSVCLFLKLTRWGFPWWSSG